MDAILRLTPLALLCSLTACASHRPVAVTPSAPASDTARLASLLAAFEVVPEISADPAAGPSDQSVATIASTLKDLDVARNVIVNNLANAQTTAFKRSRVNFENLSYLTLKQPGSVNAAGEVSPHGVFVGLGARLANTQLDLAQASLESTGRPLDVAIQGQGFFKVRIADTVGNGFGYTRNGNLFINNKGELVVGLGDGHKLAPPIASLPIPSRCPSPPTAA